MSMNEFLENRKSVRDFKSKNLSDSDLKKVESIIFDINNLAKKSMLILNYTKMVLWFTMLLMERVDTMVL